MEIGKEEKIENMSLWSVTRFRLLCCKSGTLL